MSKLNKTEKQLLEEISSMFDTKDRLGLKYHKDSDVEPLNLTRGMPYIHSLASDSFALKVADSDYAESLNQTFNKILNYKTLRKGVNARTAEFEEAFTKDLQAQGIPSHAIQKGIEAIASVVNELDEDNENWDEKDHGFNPNLDEIRKVSKPDQPLDFNIIQNDTQEPNVEWDKTDASPGRTP